MIFIQTTKDFADVMGLHIQNGTLQHLRTPIAIHIQADGDELERIRDTFDNIPMPKTRVVTWTGEMATFIGMHLC